ncbi:hypothetical protein V5O48_012494 [Marasmius crinis-equi]|uniref:Uncharacterized protein n=1 Tax=Marasmius crinis-equi TaxID=585013 RepID=A0ABR3F2L4_9AGAR
MASIGLDTCSDSASSPYLIPRSGSLPSAGHYPIPPLYFSQMLKEEDLQCTVRAIALCKRTDEFEYETLIPVVSIPGQAMPALALVERGGKDINDDQTPAQSQPKDIITLLSNSCLYWRYNGTEPPYHQLPQIIERASTTTPSPDAFVGEEKESVAKEPTPNSQADHVFIYAIEFTGEDVEPPTLLDLALVFQAVSVSDYPTHYFAAAMCKLMERLFRGRKILNECFQEPEEEHDGDSLKLRADGFRTLRIVRDDTPSFTRMIDELVKKFEEERKGHPLGLVLVKKIEADLRAPESTEWIKDRLRPELEAKLRAEVEAELRAKYAELYPRQQHDASRSANISF